MFADENVFFEEDIRVKKDRYSVEVFTLNEEVDYLKIMSKLREDWIIVKRVFSNENLTVPEEYSKDDSGFFEAVFIEEEDPSGEKVSKILCSEKILMVNSFKLSQSASVIILKRIFPKIISGAHNVRTLIYEEYLIPIIVWETGIPAHERVALFFANKTATMQIIDKTKKTNPSRVYKRQVIPNNFIVRIARALNVEFVLWKSEDEHDSEMRFKSGEGRFSLHHPKVQEAIRRGDINRQAIMIVPPENHEFSFERGGDDFVFYTERLETKSELSPWIGNRIRFEAKRSVSRYDFARFIVTKVLPSIFMPSENDRSQLLDTFF